VIPRPALGVAVLLGLCGCAGGGGLPSMELEPVADLAWSPVDAATVARWLASTRPTAVRMEVRWQARTPRRGGRGRAVISFAPPDSLRLDYRAPLGRTGSVGIVGTDVLWREPADDLEEQLAVPMLLWAAIGIARPAPEGGVVASAQDGSRRLMRYAWADSVAIYETRPDGGLGLRLLVGGEVVGVASTARADSAGLERGHAALRRERAMLALEVRSATTGPESHRPDWFSPPGPTRRDQAAGSGRVEEPCKEQGRPRHQECAR